jgi:deoxyadenosine/deoxycytidine kinase
MKARFVSIEGNIGSGKSTLLAKLRADNPDWYYVDEPVSRWMEMKENGKSILEIFYEDRPRWSYNFQSFALLTRLQAINATYQKAIDDGAINPVILMERSLETDMKIFAKMLHDTNEMMDIEWNIYNEWAKEFNKFNKVATRSIVWVDTPVNICIDRIRMRGRQGEDKIGEDYLISLDKYHNDWLNNESHINIFKFYNWGPSEAGSRITDVEEVIRFIAE